MNSTLKRKGRIFPFLDHNLLGRPLQQRCLRLS
jgi:hypothetical protein